MPPAHSSSLHVRLPAAAPAVALSAPRSKGELLRNIGSKICILPILVGLPSAPKNPLRLPGTAAAVYTVCIRLDRVAMVSCSTSKCFTAQCASWRTTPRHQQPVGRSGAALQRAQASSSVSEAATAPAFEQLYSQLAGVLATPGSAVTAAPTPLGRGLVATQPVQKGATLLSGECDMMTPGPIVIQSFIKSPRFCPPALCDGLP